MISEFATPVIEVNIDGVIYQAADYSRTRNSKESFWDRVNLRKWEPQTFRIFRQFLAENKSYIDLGAWIGPTIFYGCQLASHCYAVEPDPEAKKELQHNLKLNPKLQKKITIYDGAISNTGEIVKLGSRNGFGKSTSSILYENSEQINVNSLRFEDFIVKYKIKDVNFIKMDIEGSELLILPDMEEYLKDTKPTLHLSLHPFMFSNRNEYIDQIMQSVSLYKSIYSNNGKSLNFNTLEYLLLTENFFDIVLTDFLIS